MAIKIMVDAGHYGYQNQSPCDSRYWESKMSWQLHLYLVDALKRCGFTVGTTRQTQETDLDVYYRGTKAKGYDLFLSLHSNTATGDNRIMENVDRPVIIRYLNSSKSDDAFAQEIGDTIKLCIDAKQDTQLYRREGSRGEYYGVLRGAKAVGCPVAFILEHGFHTCTKTTEYLLDNDNLYYMAEQECKVICNHYGYEYVKPGEQPVPPQPTEKTVVYQAYIKGYDWLPEVDKADNTNDGYAGIYGKEISGIRCRVSDWEALHYQVHLKGKLMKNWLPEVDRWSDDDNGYAGVKGKPIDFLMVWSNTYEIAYQVHTVKGKWLDWVYKADINDTKNGMAGIKGKAIDGIRIKLLARRNKLHKI